MTGVHVQFIYLQSSKNATIKEESNQIEVSMNIKILLVNFYQVSANIGLIFCQGKVQLSKQKSVYDNHFTKVVVSTIK